MISPKQLTVGLISLTLLVSGGIFVTSRSELGHAVSNHNSSVQNQTSQLNAKSYSKDEVAQHSGTNDCWTIVDGNVYDLTSYVSQHPGGVNTIAPACGIDASDYFHGQMSVDGRSNSHGKRADNDLNNLYVGQLR